MDRLTRLSSPFMTGIGESPPRPDGFAKVSGAARYVDDVVLPGMWHGATLRSPHPHARIRSIRFDPAKAPQGTVCVTAADLPGPNGVQLLDDGWPILADAFTLHVGEPVALVAAPTRLAARQALAAVEVEYEPLDPVLTLEDAGSLPPLHELRLEEGDVDAALAAAARVVEGEYRTGHQEHIYIECQGMIAEVEEDGGVSVLGSMQCPYYVHKALTHALKLPDDKVRIRASVVGGGFGGKEDFPSAVALHAALLARACGRPVKLVYDRHEDIVATTKRHPAVIRHRAGVDWRRPAARPGRRHPLRRRRLLDSVTRGDLARPAALVRPLPLARRAHPRAGAPHPHGAQQRLPRLRRAPGGVRHRAPHGPHRPRDWPRSVRDPRPERRRSGRPAAHRPGARRQRLGPPLPGRGRAADRLPRALAGAGGGAGAAAATARLDAGKQKGIGLALFFHGAGFTGNGERKMKSPVTARLLEDGRIEILTAMTDMGQGCVAVFPQIAAAAAGVGPEDLAFAEPDTRLVPDSGPTVASRTTMIVGNVIARAVAELRDRVLAWRQSGDAQSGDAVKDGWITGPAGPIEPFREAARACRAAGPLEVTLRHEPPEDSSFDDSTYRGAAYPTYAWGADVVEVEVDPDTLAVRPVQVTAVCEVGRAIHPTLCKGQIEGGTLQALGWALMEEVKMKDGHYLNDRLATYIIPTIRDSPRIDVHLLERGWEGGPFGAKGVGELPMDGGAPAAAQAIENATGIPVAEIPATPEKLLRSRME